jgi:hypothetical protein
MRIRPDVFSQPAHLGESSGEKEGAETLRPTMSSESRGADAGAPLLPLREKGPFASARL